MSGSILVVDDDPVVLRSLSELISQIGLKCSIARSASVGLEILTQNKFDGLIVDFNLGGGSNGLEFIEIAREIGVECPCLLVSAIEPGGHLKRRISELNATFLAKPITIESIINGIEQP